MYINKTSIIASLLLIFGACSQQNSAESPGRAEPESDPDSLEISKTDSPAPLPTRPQPDTTSFLDLSWKTLADIDFRHSWVEELGMEVPFPVFGERVKALEGRSVQVQGYLIPLSETGDETIIVLSAFPYTQCFFCGGAGPESVIDILPAKDPGELKMDQIVTFRGRLKLNDSDFDYLNYILEEAELVE